MPELTGESGGGIIHRENIRLSNEFATNYPDSEGNTHKRLPHRNHLIIKVAHVAQGDEPPTERDFDEVFQSGKSAFTLIAPENTPLGTIGYVKACYTTFTGKQDPDSEVFKFVVN